MDRETVEKLAELARIEISDAEAEKLSGELGNILKYVGEIKEVQSANTKNQDVKPEVRNILRADTEPHESGIYTEELLVAAPDREGDYIKVKKIL